MIKFFFLLIFTCFTTISVVAQNDDTLQNLLNNKLIEQNDINSFEDILKKDETKSNSSYLFALFQIDFKKNTGYEFSRIGIQMNFAKSLPNSPEQKKFNLELKNYLTKIKNCNLINERQFSLQNEKIERSEYTHPLQLLSDLSSQVSYDEWLSSEKIINYGQKMLDNKIMSKESFEKLKIDANSNNIRSHNQLINYLEFSKLFDLSKYSNDPSVYLEQIHREVASLLPEQLSFTDFNYKIEIDSAESYKDYIAHKVTVSLKCNGKIYRQKSFISLDNNEKNKFLGKIDDGAFYEIFNKILADNNSPLRLHHTLSTTQYGQKQGFQYFGIIALNEDQVEVFRPLDFIMISYENFNGINSEKIEKSIAEFKKIGLLSHLSNSQIEKAKEKVNEIEIKNYEDVLMCLPNVTYWFDTELENLKNPYEELLKEYSKISHGEFNPTEISDDFDLEKNKFETLKFKIGKNSYTKKFKIESDWIDTDIFGFIKSVVTENNLKGQFYELFSDGQDVSIIFLNKDQYNYLKDNKLLNFSTNINF